VIYFFHNEQIPLFLLTAYAKTRKSDLTPAECRAMRALTSEIVAQYSRQQTTDGREKR